MEISTRESRIYEAIADGAMIALAIYLAHMTCVKDPDLRHAWFALKTMGMITAIWMMFCMMPEVLRLSGTEVREQLAVTLLPAEGYLRRRMRERVWRCLAPLIVTLALVTAFVALHPSEAQRYYSGPLRIFQMYGVMAGLIAAMVAAQVLDLAVLCRMLRYSCRPSPMRAMMYIGPLAWCGALLCVMDVAPDMLELLHSTIFVRQLGQWMPATPWLVVLLLSTLCAAAPLWISVMLMRREFACAARAYYRFE
ncbi:hypothetical protein JXA32_05630 [Candidatus Sumerlaeota bacterium]|nr:hypothetical protein [Candidatus Sumerlaeota bacterium]